MLQIATTFLNGQLSQLNSMLLGKAHCFSFFTSFAISALLLRTSDSGNQCWLSRNHRLEKYVQERVEFQFSEPDGGDRQGEVLDGVEEDGLCVLAEVETTVRQVGLLLHLFNPNIQR